MNRIERRVRDMVNPYSTAFAGWWCRSGRYLRPVRMITGMHAVAGPRPASRERLAVRASASTMAARKAAVDAVLAKQAAKDE